MSSVAGRTPSSFIIAAVAVSVPTTTKSVPSEVSVIWTEKVSLGSAKVSSLVATEKVTGVEPAVMTALSVTPV